MITRKLSLITCGLILTASSAVAGSTVADAFKDGKASGDISIYSAHVANEGDNKDSGFTAGTVGVSYESEKFYNFSVKTSFRAGHEFSEKETNDYDNELPQDAVMNEAYIKYENEELKYSIVLGRQEVDLEWIGDFNEALTAEITSLPNTTLTAGFADRQAYAGVDELVEFEELSQDGIYFLDAKNESLEGVELNPYYYNIRDVAKFYGMKATYSNDMFGVLGHYVTSSEDVAGAEDGSIAQVELSTTISNISIAAGYIKTDKDGGIGSMGEYGDNINPIDEGAQIYEADAKTVYASVSTNVMDIDLSVIYSDTEYGTDESDESELNLIVGTELAENLGLEILYISVDAEDSDDDWDKIAATVTYSF